MKVIDILDFMNDESGVTVRDTVDTVLARNEEERSAFFNREVRKAVVCFTAEPSVVRRAKAFGADLILTHEPTFYNHRDVVTEESLCVEKFALVRDAGCVVMRYHDHMHRTKPDWIHLGFMTELGLPYQWTEDGLVELAEPVTARFLADRIKKALGLKAIRFIGNPEAEGRTLMLALGETGPDAPLEKLHSGEIQFVICGEANEWKLGEYVRDAGSFGRDAAVFTLGHSMSEKPGMRRLCDKLTQQFPEIEWQYLESEEMYSEL